MIFRSLISIFSKTLNKCFSISDFELKQYEKASTYLTEEPIILLRFYDKEELKSEFLVWSDILTFGYI